jgi:hypothetical protein
MLFLRILTHLLPRGRAWRVTTDKPLRRLVEGLAEGVPPQIRGSVDTVFAQAFPDSSSELTEWEKQFGVTANPNDTIRRQLLSTEWFAAGGQSPRYIQDVLQSAGFNLYVHEWWDGPNVSPRTKRDPRAYTVPPQIGTEQCTSSEPDIVHPPTEDEQPQCSSGFSITGTPIRQPQCNRFLANDPHYFDNKTLTDEAPPPIPNDPAKWPYFLYVGAATFPNFATIPTSRRAEFERLILKVRPTHNWIVTLINFVDEEPPAPPFFFGPSSPGFGTPWSSV